MNQETSAKYIIKGNQLQRFKRFDDAIAVYNQAIELNPYFSWYYIKLGDALFAKGDYGEAAKSYVHAVELNPLLSSLHNKLGQAIEKEGNLDRAISFYRRAIELDSNSYQAHYCLGEALTQQGKLKEAIISYKKAQEINPNWAKPYHSWGRTLFKQGDLNEATELYKKALNLKPDLPSAHQELAEILEKLGLLDEALATLYRFRSINLNNYIYFLKLGDILWKKGLLDEAVSSYRNAMKLSPRSPRVYRSLGYVLQKQGLLNEAISEFYKFVQLRPNSLEPYEILGKALEEASLFEEAADVYLNGIKANQKHIKLHLNLGKVLEQQNKFIDAIKHYKKAGNTEASRLLGKCLAKQGLEKSYEEKWHSLNQLTTDKIKKLNTHEANETDSIAVEEYFRQTSPYRVISIDSIDKSDLEFLSINGFSLDKFDFLRQENIDHTEVSSNSIDGSLDNNKSLSEDFSWCNEGHQITILKTGYIYSRCPKSGRIIKSNQSLYIFYGLVKPVYLYRFVGDEVFYLMIGGVGGSKLFAYIPRIELIVLLRSVNIPPEEVINKLKAYCVTFFHQVSLYIKDNSPKDIAVIVGDTNNIGHHIWNELSAIQNLCDTGIINKISQVFIGIHEFLNIEDIFPELSGKVVRFSTERDFFRLLIEKNYISVRVTGKLIQNQLAERIYRTSVLKCDNDFLEQVERVKQQHFPLLLIQVRTFRLKWLSQVEGLASLIRQLSDDFPNLGVVFDGWSLPERQEHSNIVVSKIRQTKACMENIINILPQEIRTYNTIGYPIYKTIIWAHAVSLYVIPMGSGVTIPRWIANKPGVVYGNKYKFGLFKDQMNSANSHRENCAPLFSIPLSNIREVTPGDPESDYDLDWQVLYKEVMNVLTGVDRLT